ncbi:unnamed protein product [Blepharisma stoltei]|uniref:EF-hand domain-containing protein n=1 Tax=Blepharisma stoltei TaxID=1481888 RepID=A0AAU9J728_9CILI|nr:unnamed protein product [Blepharisma stoltei]
MASLRLGTEKKLAEFFSVTAQGERDAENARIALSENREFDPYAAFKALDRFNNGYLNYLDIKSFLEKNRIFASTQEVDLLIKQYDSDSDSRLILSDFQQLTCPSTSVAIRDLAISRSGPLRLSLDVEFLLSRLLEKEISLQRRLETIRKELEASPDFSIFKAFETIDYPPTSFVTRNKIFDFLRKNLVSAFNDDIDGILRRLDIDGDERLSYGEFSDAIKCASPSIVVHSPARESQTVRHSSPLRRSPSPNRTADREFRTSGYLDSSRSLTKSSFLETSGLKSPRRSPTRSQFLSSSNGFNKSLETSGLKSPRRSGNLEKSLSRSPTRSQLLSSSNGFNKTARSQPEESEIVNVFIKQIGLDRDLEASRRDLALCSDFTLIDAFNIFDINNYGFVTQVEFEEGLRSLGILPIKDEVSLLFKHFALVDRRLTFSDFCKIVTTKDLEYSRLINGRIPQNLPRYERRRTFRLNTEGLFVKVMKLLLENESVAESLRQQLERRPYFSISEAFQCVDKDRNGFITFDEFQVLLGDYGIYVTRKDVENLMERYDKDRDGRVSYSEFLNEVTPKSPRRY